MTQTNTVSENDITDSGTFDQKFYDLYGMALSEDRFDEKLTGAEVQNSASASKERPSLNA